MSDSEEDRSLFVSPSASVASPAAPASSPPIPGMSSIAPLIAPAPAQTVAPPHAPTVAAPAGVPHQVEEYTDFSTSAIRALQQRVRDFAGTDAEHEALIDRLSQEWNRLKESLMDFLDENIRCPTCHEIPDETFEVTDQGIHRMSERCREMYQALRDWDWAGEEEMMERPKKWLRGMEKRFQLVEETYWAEELSGVCPGNHARRR